MDLHADATVIATFGGPTVLAELCGVTPQAVSQWRRAGIPKPWRKYLQLLRPEAFVAHLDAPSELARQEPA